MHFRSSWVFLGIVMKGSWIFGILLFTMWPTMFPKFPRCNSQQHMVFTLYCFFRMVGDGGGRFLGFFNLLFPLCSQ
jgi:hypothetical protein